MNDKRIRPTPTVLITTLATVVVVLVFMSFRLSESLADSKSDSTRAQRAADQRIAAAAQRAVALTGTMRDQSMRIASLEARLASQRDPAEVAAAVRRSVFTVSSGEGGPGGGLGSGFVLVSTETRSIVVTNYHVVANQWVTKVGAVTVQRGDESYLGTVERVSEADDLAVITVPRPLPALTVVKEHPKVGDALLVAGFPLERGWFVSSATVSALDTDEGADAVWFSAPLGPGDTGGPVVDREGHVVAITVPTTAGQGIEGTARAVLIAKVCRVFGIC
jgi:putative serine protease PepD